MPIPARPHALSKSAGFCIQPSARGLSQARGYCTAAAQREMGDSAHVSLQHTGRSPALWSSTLADYLSFCDRLRPRTRNVVVVQLAVYEGVPPRTDTQRKIQRQTTWAFP